MGAPAGFQQAVSIRPPQPIPADLILPPESVAVNNQGLAVVVWREEVGDTYRLLASRFDGGCWEPPAVFDGALSPVAVIDEAGSATVAWHEHDAHGGGDEIWAARHEAGAWQPAQRISMTPPAGSSLYAKFPSIAVDQEGNVFAAWNQSENGAGTVGWNRHGPNGWTTPGIIATISSGVSDDVRVACADPSLVIALYRQPSGAAHNLWASRWMGTGWDSGELVGDPLVTGTYDGVDRIQLLGRGTGGIVAAWRQTQGTTSATWWNQYDTTAQMWTGPLPIPAIPAEGQRFDIGVDDAGDAVTVWNQPDGNVDNLWAARFVPGAGWSAAVPLENMPTNASDPVAVGMDGQGRALAIWSNHASATDIWPDVWVSESTLAKPWTAPQNWNVKETGGDVPIAVSRSGYAVAAWRGMGDQLSVWAMVLPPDSWGL